MSKQIKYRKASYRFYRVAFKVAGPVLCFFRPFDVIGKENLREGAALICSNHSAMVDPFLIALSSGIDRTIHVFAKIELYRVPVVATVLWKLGMIPVDRSINDITSIKTALNYLKSGKRVVIFPEGTRAAEHDASAAKSGAVKLAERAGVPIVPVFIPRKKPFFRKCTLVFGEPYSIEKQKVKRTVNDYSKLSEELMNKIQDLGTASS